MFERSASTVNSLFIIYGLFQQMVSRDGDAGSLKGLTVGGRLPSRLIMPDLQYIITPSGSSAIANALVLGAQVAISF